MNRLLAVLLERAARFVILWGSMIVALELALPFVFAQIDASDHWAALSYRGVALVALILSVALVVFVSLAKWVVQGHGVAEASENSGQYDIDFLEELV